MKKQHWKYLAWFILAVVFYFPVFLHLDVLPVAVWDESLFGLRAFHYYEFGTYMDNLNNFEWLHDHRNTKLPFTTWFQVGFMHLFGVNELALRLPISLIFLSTIGYCIYFFNKYINAYWTGVLMGLFLIASSGWVAPHMLRTGDQDVPFACYLLIASLSFFRYLQERKNIDLFVFTFFIIAALLTKNLLVGFLLPGLLLYSVLDKKILTLLTNWKVWLSLLLIIGSYALTLYYYEYRFEGFIERMWNWELGGRYTSVIDEHAQPWWFYLNQIYIGMSPYGIFVPISLGLFWFKDWNNDGKQLFVMLHSIFWTYLISLSFSSTKIYWYASPLYIIGACICALFFHKLWLILRDQEMYPLRNALFTGLMISFIYPYGQVVHSVYKPMIDGKQNHCGICMDRVRKKQPNIKEYKVVERGWGTSALWYTLKYNDQRPEYDVEFSSTKDYPVGTYILSTVDHGYDYYRKRYKLTILHESKHCRLMHLDERLIDE